MKTENQEILEEISKYSCNDTHKAIASRVFIALRNEYRVKDIQIQYSAEQQTIYFIGTNEADNIQELYVPTADYKLDFKEINKIANDLDPQKQFNGLIMAFVNSSSSVLCYRNRKLT